ncbi:hypothetical protein [Bacterioplanoides sp. SCSIO 12839]|uniref:hypothetical protein n=1 Tax=Bacterioplanoides sp. SCSIO 12839 TaxID=2829569 RepID=UPI0021071228|nr:hypothetical protein [Bacterioplanoides sp. SCSIO 12839]UTW47863.1 hypothetical protein KFF03_15045 [Bacterioplanoides sp. SCSIO 12839]
MSHALSAKQDQDTPTVSTILSNQVMIPVTCDKCRCDTDVSLSQIKQQMPIMCEHCYDVKAFSDSELQLTQLFLAQAGYHFAR